MKQQVLSNDGGRAEKVSKAKLALLSMQRHSWEQGLAMQAFLESGDEEIVIAMAQEAANRRLEDGRLAAIGVMEAATDPCAVGEALLFAIVKTDCPVLKQARDELLDWALTKAPRSRDGIVYHMTDRQEFWVDSMYMLPPCLAVYGEYAEALKQLNGYWSRLYDAEKGLLSHIWDEGKGVFTRRDFWGVGNGWALACLVRMIDLLPAGFETERAELVIKACKLIESVSRHIRQDGLAHDVLDVTNTFVETNLPQMLSYSIYRGMLSGWLPANYKNLADTCRHAAEAKVDRYGFVRGVCGAPHFISPGIAPEGQAFFLLMEAAEAKLKKV